MEHTSIFRKEYLIGLLPLGVLLAWSASFYPGMIEKYYSTGANRVITKTLSQAAGLFPFSLAEIGIISLLLASVWWAVRLLAALLNRRLVIAGKMLVNALIGISSAYFVFILLWGLNYYRLPFSDTAHLKVEPASPAYLAEVCEDLIGRTNRLRFQVQEDKNGVMQLSGGKKEAFKRAAAGYLAAGSRYPVLSGNYGRPKYIVIKGSLSYAGFSGVYCPFTGEPNVDGSLPEADLVYTVCHEMAHQRGFAREDEANYISYLTCSMNPDPGFKYAGSLLAVIQSMNMLEKYDPESYKRLERTYCKGLKRDLAESEIYWQSHKGKLWKLTDRVNDIYLKSNGQSDGVYSYNRMVDLLIAEHRAGRIH